MLCLNGIGSCGPRAAIGSRSATMSYRRLAINDWTVGVSTSVSCPAIHPTSSSGRPGTVTCMRVRPAMAAYRSNSSG